MTTKDSKAGIALITGANRGLGLEVSRQLGVAGFRILLGSRSPARGSDAQRYLKSEGVDADVIPLDVCSPASIEAAALLIEERYPRLDVLVNNAAIHYDSWQRVCKVDWNVVTEALEVNTLGPWRISLALLPLLKRSPHPRIVNVSSEAGSQGSLTGGTPAYSLSKAGLNSVTRMLAAELKAEGVLVNAVCPGWTRTDMGGTGGRPISEGAKGIVWAATLSEDGPTGGFYRDGQPIEW